MFDGKGVPLSTNLDIILHKIISEKSKVFTSATKPLLLLVEYSNKAELVDKDKLMMMFKTGDDMRQDQLINQLFNIMDILLKNDGLDLHFIQHNLIAFTKDDGINKFTANSKTITDLKKTYSRNPIKTYLS